MGILYYLQNPEIVDNLITISERTGYDIYYLTAVAFGEGYIEHAKYKVESGRDTVFTNTRPMGLDSFGDKERELKVRGYLRQDYNGFEKTGGFSQNESGEKFLAGKFKDPESAIEGLAALLRYFEGIARQDLGGSIGAMKREEIEAWTYVYYNAGLRVGREVLKKYGPHRILGRYTIKIYQKDARYNSNRIMGTTILLRSLRIFDPDSRALNHYLQFSL